MSLKKIVSIFSLAAALAVFGQAAAQADITCNVNFDTYSGFPWSKVWNMAKDTFAYPTKVVNGVYDRCDPAPSTDTGACYVYRQQCVGGKFITVYPQNYSHYHATFDDPTIACYDYNAGGFGRKVPGNSYACSSIDYTKEPRHISSHDGTEIIEIAWKANNSTYYTVNSFNRITVGKEPIQFWYSKPNNGGVWGWSYLGGNTTWALNTGPFVKAWVVGYTGQTYDILDFSVTVPY